MTLSLKVYRSTILFLLLFCWASNNFVTANYREKRVLVNCFMKTLMDFSQEELSSGQSNSSSLERFPVFPTSEPRILEAGKKIFQAHRETIENLLTNFDSNLETPIPNFTEEKLKALRSTSLIPDFKYIRTMCKCLQTVSYYLYREGRHEEALKVQLLVFRYGQIFMAGDGEPPTLIQVMVGLAIKNLGMSPLTWQIIMKGSMKPDFVAEITSILGKAIQDEPKFHQLIEAENRYALNSIEYELMDFEKNPVTLEEGENQLKVIREILKNQDKNAVVTAIKKKVDVAQNRARKLLEAYSSDFPKLEKNLKNLETGIVGNAQKAEISQEDTIEAAGDLLLNMMYPNFHAAYSNYLKAKYKSHGVLLLLKLKKASPQAKNWPTDAENFTKLTGTDIPFDYFSTPKIPCIFKKFEDKTILYSLGKDGKDNGGNDWNDVILFKY